jgi:hypothetical protein
VEGSIQDACMYESTQPGMGSELPAHPASLFASIYLSICLSVYLSITKQSSDGTLSIVLGHCISMACLRAMACL